MRVLRSSFFEPMGDKQPITIVVSEHSLKNPNWDIEALRKDAEQPGVFAITEVLEMEDGLEDPRLTIEVMNRIDFEAERAMAILYYYDSAQLRIARSEAVIFATKPAPLSVERIKRVLRQIAKHPDYKRQKIMVIASDETIVTMHDGEISS